jgi:hypothetical protein
MLLTSVIHRLFAGSAIEIPLKQKAENSEEKLTVANYICQQLTVILSAHIAHRARSRTRGIVIYV